MRSAKILLNIPDIIPTTPANQVRVGGPNKHWWTGSILQVTAKVGWGGAVVTGSGEIEQIVSKKSCSADLAFDA